MCFDTEKLSGSTTDALVAAAVAIHQADAVFIAAGAGMSAECGLPNFNTTDSDLFWSMYPALKKKGLLLKGCSHPALFENDACTAWGFYGSRYEV